MAFGIIFKAMFTVVFIKVNNLPWHKNKHNKKHLRISLLLWKENVGINIGWSLRILMLT